MRPKTLYGKLLLAFIGVLFVTEILILALFISTAGRGFRKNIHLQTVAKLVIFKQSVADKLAQFPHLPLEDNSELITLLATFSKVFDLKIWITGLNNDVLFQTEDSIPNLVLKQHAMRETHQEGIRLYHLSRRHLSYYAAIRMVHNDNAFILHLYLNKTHEKKPEAIFLFGLLIIGGAIALMIVPLTRLITKRLARLNQSALDFADGNLKRRIDMKGHDEIAALGKSFNFMADKLEIMIQGSKEMMANISHELRSPLARIRMSQELISERLNSGATKDLNKYTKYIDQDIETLDRLIDRILLLSKMDFQNVTTAKEKVILASFFNEISERFRPALQSKNIEVITKIENGLHLYWDLQALDTICSNLLDNAVKYSTADSQIRVCAQKSNNNCILFTITNPYRQLTQKQLEDMFKPFYREDKDDTAGSGLGLAIVKKLMEKNDAVITAKNGGSGLVFELEFKNQ